MVKRASRSDESRTEVITARLTKAERARLEFNAASAGLTLSAYASKLLTGGRVTVETRPAGIVLPPELLAEFKRIGNNVNQIAHALNSRKAVAEGAVANQFRDFVRALMKNASLAAIARPIAAEALKART